MYSLHEYLSKIGNLLKFVVYLVEVSCRFLLDACIKLLSQTLNSIEAYLLSRLFCKGLYPYVIVAYNSCKIPTKQKNEVFRL